MARLSTCNFSWKYHFQTHSLYSIIENRLAPEPIIMHIFNKIKVGNTLNPTGPVLCHHFIVLKRLDILERHHY